MSDWKNPNLRNHVNNEDGKFKYGDFNKQTIFKNRETQTYYPYMLNDLHNEQNYIFKSIDNEKREKYINILENSSPKYTFIESSNNKAMQDSFYGLGNVYLYQIILSVNKIWSILDYDMNNTPSIFIPTKSNITNILTDMLTDKQFHNVHEFTNEDDIRNAIDRITIDIQNDKYGISKIISEKLYLNQNQVIKRLNSPIFKKYLISQIKSLLNKDEESLIKETNEMLKRINIYKKDNGI